MVAHRRHVTVGEDGQITISGLPFRPGQRLHVTIVEEADRKGLTDGLRALFRRLQARPQIKPLTDDEIAQEIAAHRRSRGAA